MDLKFSAEAGDGRQQVKGGWQKKDVVKVLPVSLSSPSYTAQGVDWKNDLS